MSHKILVTCATGNVGRELVQQLAEAGEEVVAASRTPAEATFPDGVEPVALDLARPETFEAAFRGVDRLFLLTPADEPGFVERMQPIIEYAARADLRRLVNMSYMGVQRAEFDPFGHVEQIIDSWGIPWTSIQPNWFMQNFVTYDLGAIREHSAIFAPAADARCSFVDTRDIAAVAAAALTEQGHEGQAHVVTGPEPLTHTELAATISRASGREVGYMAMDDEAFAGAMAVEGYPPHTIEMFGQIYGAMRDGLNAPVTDTVARVTGRSPTSFAQFAAEHADLWR